MAKQNYDKFHVDRLAISAVSACEKCIIKKSQCPAILAELQSIVLLVGWNSILKSRATQKSVADRLKKNWIRIIQTASANEFILLFEKPQHPSNQQRSLQSKQLPSYKQSSDFPLRSAKKKANHDPSSIIISEEQAAKLCSPIFPRPAGNGLNAGAHGIIFIQFPGDEPGVGAFERTTTRRALQGARLRKCILRKVRRAWMRV